SVAGMCYDTSTSALHVFGVTRDEPPAYYHRVIGKTASGLPSYGVWTKVTLQIPVRKISPVMYRGRLYVFWIETTTRAVSSFQGGNTHFDGYRHLIRVKYSTARPDGTWTAPQSLSFAEGKVTEEGRSIEDPTSGVDAKQALQDQLDTVNDQIAQCE